jgi:hypothetical protein
MRWRTDVVAAYVLLGTSTVVAQSSGTAATQNADAVTNGEFRRLDAEYALSNQHYVDPDPNAPIDRVRIYIKGEDAKRIYQSMVVQEQRVDCEGRPQDGYTRKVAGGFECDRSEKWGYTCSVAIMFDTGATEQAYVCD